MLTLLLLLFLWTLKLQPNPNFHLNEPPIPIFHPLLKSQTVCNYSGFVLVFIFILPAVKKFGSCPCYLMLHPYILEILCSQPSRGSIYAMGFVWLVVLAKYGGKMQKRAGDDRLLVLLELFKLTHPSFLFTQIDKKNKKSILVLCHAQDHFLSIIIYIAEFSCSLYLKWLRLHWLIDLKTYNKKKSN